jgi:hypothetical protein
LIELERCFASIRQNAGIIDVQIFLEPAAVSEVDQAVLDRFRDQIDSELGEAEDSGQGGRRIRR